MGNLLKFIWCLFLICLFIACNSSDKSNKTVEQSKEVKEDFEYQPKSVKRTYSIDEEINYGMSTNKLDYRGGLNEGDIAPNFISTDHLGKKYELYEELKKHEVLLVFYRGEWCPICAKHLSDFEDDLYRLNEKNIKAFAVTPEKPEKASLMIDKTDLSVPVLIDSDHQIMKDYMVLFEVTDDYHDKVKSSLGTDITISNGDEVAVLPVPATYLISKDKKIKYVHYDPNFSNRADVSMILDNRNE